MASINLPPPFCLPSLLNFITWSRCSPPLSSFSPHQVQIDSHTFLLAPSLISRLCKNVIFFYFLLFFSYNSGGVAHCNLIWVIKKKKLPHGVLIVWDWAACRVLWASPAVTTKLNTSSVLSFIYFTAGALEQVGRMQSSSRCKSCM